MKSSFKKEAAMVIAAVLIIGFAAGGAYLKSVLDYQRAVREITITEVRLSDVPDGAYAGECDVDFIRAKVEVTVRHGAITGIRILEHKNGRGQAAETVVEEIVSRQKLNVDAVSGATNSSTVLKKAVENALESALP